MEFPIALLALAAFLFITGMVGHGATVGGPMGLKIGLDGRVGPVPRLVFVVLGTGIALSAVVAFVLALPNPNPTPGPTPGPAPGIATVYVLVGIRPALGQVSENLKLVVDDRTAASWFADQQHATRTVPVSLKPGTHTYQVQGTYSYVAPTGVLTQQSAAGSGTFTVRDGAQFGMNFNSATNQFELIATS